MTLLNFRANPTPTQFWMSGVFTLIALMSLFYSVAVYLYRSKSIRNRKAARYFDKWGPSVLCVSLFVAVAANFAFEGRERDIW